MGRWEEGGKRVVQALVVPTDLSPLASRPMPVGVYGWGSGKMGGGREKKSDRVLVSFTRYTPLLTHLHTCSVVSCE